MFPFFSYIHRPFSILLLLFCLLFPPPLPATYLPVSATGNLTDFVTNNTWHTFVRFMDAEKGSRPDGMAELKRYFRRFGYLPPENQNLTDLFDDEFEQALILYQRNLGLNETGRLDHPTMKVIVSPRCGVGDFTDAGRGGGGGGGDVKTTRRFAYFYGQPRWVRTTPMMLTYAFSPGYVIDYVGMPEIRAAFAAAFGRWSAVIPVNFTESEDYPAADIRIGWYSGDHGDGEAFDGVLGVLAHAFSPENGRFHLDAAERWAVDFEAERSKVAIDLESVATHEIGHVLGLAHSSVREAVMYPNLSPRTRKVGLRMDDVEGIQALYGSNPNYRYDSRLESDLSSGRAMDPHRRKGLMWVAAMAVVACLLGLRL
ncbi:metalloendoproteinase 4-MMP [Salvia miltiorrhiza]|uniref:metalloendoproteinase 4-MMP n=1 Tax=Salvia miltiorrhiza TaxID=226208 RepID=UPI0025AC2279|nr:metalloendoproteinase 4-MMP [Salvia miltiorrhiza]